jgi:phage terminase large subunit-like protein
MDTNQLTKVRKLLLSNFSYFAQTLADPDFFDEAFHVDLCKFMQHSGHNKLVVLPRTFLKTTIAATYYSLWRATRDPGIRILIVSNTDTNAAKTVHTIRSVVEQNENYRLFFPDRLPVFSKTRWSDSCACLARPIDHPEGTFESAGVGSNIIRRHFNVIIEDDTVAPKKDELSGEEAMPSKDDIEKAVGFHRLTIPLLINEEDERIVIGTRWSSFDLINHVKGEESFDVYDKPCLTEEGKPVYKKFSQTRLDMIRQGMGSYMFSMLYLNKPLAKEYMAFNPDWFKYYTDDQLPEEGETKVTVDPADPPTGKKSQDYTAILSCKHTKVGRFVRRYVRKRLTDKELISETFACADKDNATTIRIEVNRYAHLEAAFREEMKVRNKYYIIEAVKAKGNKEGRIKSQLSPIFENGMIFLKRDMRELEEELTTFPYGRHDDLIDALAWQIDAWSRNEYPTTTIEARPKVIAAKRITFTLDQIRNSVRSSAHKNVPFARQFPLRVDNLN